MLTFDETLTTGEHNVTDMTVTPTQEDDSTMKAFTQVLDFVNKARDAVIQASSLAKEVAEVRTELNSLKAEIEEAHRKNAEFETQLSYVRQERDNALVQAQTWEREYVNANTSKEHAERELNLLQGRHDELTHTHNSVLLDREEERRSRSQELDAAHMEVRRLREDFETERNAHEKLKAELAAIYNRVQPQPRNERGEFAPYETPKVASSW